MTSGGPAIDRDGERILDILRHRAVPRRGTLDGRRFLKRVYEHGLAGLLAESIDRLGSGASPDLVALVPDLRGTTRAQEATVRHKLDVAAEVSAALDRSGVAAVWVKGAALAVTVYERPGLRPFGDLDLLVAPDSVPGADRALVARGFRRDPATDTMAANYERPERTGPLAIDLHWDFVQRNGPQAAVEIPVGEIVSRARRAGGLPVPAPEDGLLLAAANLVRSRLDRFILLVDFARLAAADPRWDHVLERAAAWRLKTSLWLGLSLAAGHLDAPVPADVLRVLAPPRWKGALLRSILSGSSFWARRKVRARAVADGLPLLCADSAGDAVKALVRSRTRLWGRFDRGRR